MALAPYWLMPRLCPLPVPVIVKVPLLEALAVPPPLMVEVPEADSTEALAPRVDVFPLPLRTLTPLRELNRVSSSLT